MIKGMARKQGVTEQLKAEDMMRHGNGGDPSGGKDGWQERTFSKNRIL